MRAQNGTRDCRGELACVMPLTRFPHIETHLHIVPHGKLVVLPGAAGLPGCCRGAAGVLPGVAGLPGTWTHILTAGLGSQAAGLPGCRALPGTAGYCRVAGSLPGRCRVAGVGARSLPISPLVWCASRGPWRLADPCAHSPRRPPCDQVCSAGIHAAT